MNDVVVGQGYLRQDGSKGIRNKVLLIYTVECSKHVCEQIKYHFPAHIGVVDCVGNEDCDGNQVVLRQLLRYATHPNVGGVLVVGMGCEFIKAEKIASFARDSGRKTACLHLQKDGGTNHVIVKGAEIVRRMLAVLQAVPRVPFTLRDISVGAECGGSDFTSGIVANPLVGDFFDQISDAGGVAIVEEMHEAVGLKEYLVSRGATEKAKKEISLSYDKTIRFCRTAGRFSISPGNYDGGLSTIEEKSMGAVAKTGSRPIQGVLKIAQKPPTGGVWLVDVMPDYTPESSVFHGGDSSAMMSLAAAGCQLLLLVSGLGHVAGNPLCPVLKITANAETFARMSDDFDFDASPVLAGNTTRKELLAQLCQKVSAVCSGERVKAENAGYCSPTLATNNQDATHVVEKAYY